MSANQGALDPALVEQILEYAREQQLGLTVCSSNFPSTSSSLKQFTGSHNVLNSIPPFSGNVLGPLVTGLRLLHDSVSTFCCDPIPPRNPMPLTEDHLVDCIIQGG